MGKFRPGKSGNPSGRKPGSKNKLNASFREILSEALTIDDILADIAECSSAYHRASLKIKLLKFAHPELRSIEVKDETYVQQFLSMDPEERRALILELKQPDK